MVVQGSVAERAYWVAWSQVPGMGPTLLMRLYHHFGSLEQAWQASLADWLAVEGIGEQTGAIAHKAIMTLDPAALLHEHEQANPLFWTPAEPDYPRLLLEIPDPPPLLYYRGVIDASENQGVRPMIGIVGTRSPTDYGNRWTRRLAQALVNAGFTIVSGMAEGVDAIAHQACLDAGGRTIGVMGTGVNKIYPRKNLHLAKRTIEHGLVLSEYPINTPPDRVNFPRRNRIIAGLCRATIVIEAGSQSGALITARVANDYGREVYALPGSIDNPTSRGCLELIEKGAQLILDEVNLLESLGHLPNLDLPTSPESQLALLPPEPPSLSPELSQVFRAVPLEATSLDLLVQETGMATNAVLSALVQLELMGLVLQVPGMRYQRS
ncbi:MAG: DNA-processing protein DprA [Cyanobacteria bacterium J06638_20]